MSKHFNITSLGLLFVFSCAGMESSLNQIVGFNNEHDNVILNARTQEFIKEIDNYRKGIESTQSIAEQLQQANRRCDYFFDQLNKNKNTKNIISAFLHHSYQQAALLTFILSQGKKIKDGIKKGLNLLDKADTHGFSVYSKRDRGLLSLGDKSTISNGLELIEQYLEKARNIIYRAHSHDQWVIKKISQSLAIITGDKTIHKDNEQLLANAYYVLGLSLSFLSLSEEEFIITLNAFQKAVELNRPEALFDMGMLCFRRNKHHEAMQYFEQLCQIVSEKTHVQYKQAQAWWMKGILKFPAECMFDLHRACELAKGNSNFFHDCYIEVDMEILCKINQHLKSKFCENENAKLQLTTDDAYTYYLLSRLLLCEPNKLVHDTGIKTMTVLAAVNYEPVLKYLASDMGEAFDFGLRLRSSYLLAQLSDTNQVLKEQYKQFLYSEACKGNLLAQAYDLNLKQSIKDPQELQAMLEQQFEHYMQRPSGSVVYNSDSLLKENIFLTVLSRNLSELITKMSESSMGAALFCGRCYLAGLSKEGISNSEFDFYLVLAHAFINRFYYLLVQKNDDHLKEWESYYGFFMNSLGTIVQARTLQHPLLFKFFAKGTTFGNANARYTLGSWFIDETITPKIFKDIYNMSLTADQIKRIGMSLLETITSFSTQDQQFLEVQEKAKLIFNNAANICFAKNQRCACNLKQEKVTSFVIKMDAKIKQEVLQATKAKTAIEIPKKESNAENKEEVKPGPITHVTLSADELKKQFVQMTAIIPKLHMVVDFLSGKNNELSYNVALLFAQNIAVFPKEPVFSSHGDQTEFLSLQKKYESLLADKANVRSQFLLKKIEQTVDNDEMTQLAKKIWSRAMGQLEKNDLIIVTDIHAAFEILPEGTPIAAKLFKDTPKKALNNLREYINEIQRQEKPKDNQLATCYYISRVLVQSKEPDMHKAGIDGILFASLSGSQKASMFMVSNQEQSHELFSPGQLCNAGMCLITAPNLTTEKLNPCLALFSKYKNEGFLFAQHLIASISENVHKQSVSLVNWKQYLEDFFTSLESIDPKKGMFYIKYDRDHEIWDEFMKKKLHNGILEIANKGNIGAQIFFTRIFLAQKTIKLPEQEKYLTMIKDYIAHIARTKTTDSYRHYLAYLSYSMAVALQNHSRQHFIYWLIQGKKFGHYMADFLLALELLNTPGSWKEVCVYEEFKDINSQKRAEERGEQLLTDLLGKMKETKNIKMHRSVLWNLMQYYNKQKHEDKIALLITQNYEFNRQHSLENIANMTKEDFSLHLQELLPILSAIGTDSN